MNKWQNNETLDRLVHYLDGIIFDNSYKEFDRVQKYKIKTIEENKYYFELLRDDWMSAGQSFETIWFNVGEMLKQIHTTNKLIDNEGYVLIDFNNMSRENAQQINLYLNKLVSLAEKAGDFYYSSIIHISFQNYAGHYFGGFQGIYNFLGVYRPFDRLFKFPQTLSYNSIVNNDVSFSGENQPDVFLNKTKSYWSQFVFRKEDDKILKKVEKMALKYYHHLKNKTLYNSVDTQRIKESGYETDEYEPMEELKTNEIIQPTEEMMNKYNNVEMSSKKYTDKLIKKLKMRKNKNSK